MTIARSPQPSVKAVTLRLFRAGRGVRMSNEFKPGHPVLFFLFVVALTFAFYSAAKAMVSIDDCGSAGAAKTWQVWPPEWKCG